MSHRKRDRGKRSPHSRATRRERFIDYENDRTDRQIINDTFLDYALYDPVNGDKVFCVEVAATIFNHLGQEFTEIPEYAWNLHESGDVLNRFALTVFRMVSYVRGRGVFQQ